uniref:F-box domain-containing protein n=1 Tax=Leersia perrieri TaxID=77586 RepID=A0A0D9XLE6_9ORYZ
MAAATGWSSLPADLMGEITGRLSTDADHINIHQVCTHWRTLTSLPSFLRPLVLARRTYWAPALAAGDDEYSIRILRGRNQVSLCPGLNSDLECILFWRPGDDDWSILGKFVPRSIASHGGKIYCIDSKEKMTVVYDLGILGLTNQQPPYTTDLHCRFRHPDFAEVYRLKWTPEGKLELSERVTNLGEHALFLGQWRTQEIYFGCAYSNKITSTQFHCKENENFLIKIIKI